MTEDDDRNVLEPQGNIIAGQILVPESAIADDIDLVMSVVDFVNWTMETALLVFGEVAPEAYWSYHADYYLAQVNNGGHGQFAGNSRMSAQSLDKCRRGLVAMGATDYVAIFDAFMAIMTGDPARAEAIRDGGGFGNIDPEIKALDGRFYDLKSMTALNAAWLRGLPFLRPLPPDQLKAEYAAIIARNPLHAARQQHLQRVREHHAATDPMQVAARATCAQEGIEFDGFNAGMPGENGAISWGMRTSAGFRWLRIDSFMATMYTEKGALRGLYFFDSRDCYPSGTGNGAPRQSLIAVSASQIRERIDAALRATPHQQRKPSALVFCEILAQTTPTLVSNLCAASKRTSVAMACPYSREIASHASYIPRTASPRFARSEEYAVFRLIIANALWDSMLAMDPLTDAILADRDHAAALLANLGAAAALAASSVQLLNSKQIHALSLIAVADLNRELINMRLQLQEITRWWQRFVASAIARFTKTEFPQRKSLFGNPRLSHARLLAQQLRPEATSGIADALAYFDSEYPALPDAQLPAIYDKAIEQMIKRFANSRSRTSTWVGVVAEIRRVIATVYPYDAIEIFAVPKPEQFLKRQEFFGSVTAVRGTSKENQYFVFDESGARKPL